MRTLLLVILVLAAAYVAADTGYTVIIAEEKSGDCKVLEGFDQTMDQYIPEGWSRIEIDEGMCRDAVEKLKKKDFDQNFRDYLELVNCSKETGQKSIAYLGLGADEICEIAGYDYKSSKLIIQPEADKIIEVEAETNYMYIVVGLLVLILAFIVLILKKKRDF